MKIFASLVALSLVSVTVAQATEYCAWSDSTNCDGAGFCFNDGGAVCSGPVPGGFGFAWNWDNLPVGSQGQVYSDACSSFIDKRFGPGNQCWTGGGERAPFGNWFHSASGRRAIGISRGVNATDCAPPAVFKYTDGTGAKKSIKLTAGEGDAEKVAALFHVQDYEALAAYPAPDN